ncbi:MAG: class I lanthipeptide [Bacteroidota bacterium]
MKKKKFTSKLSLGKTNVSNLSEVRGGYYPPFESEYNNCNGTGSGGSGGTHSNNCSGQTCGNCNTAAHPLSDPLHCRTCHTGC